ncbi:hypothetical protein M3Y98_00818800 [Aphelenchoides besseyi]|nr:hypothetical protein M3Y98_00818800 [Aphelenchoides besseyi]
MMIFFSWLIVVCNVGQNWFLNQLVFSVLFLTLERTYSTLKAESYERKGCSLSVCAMLIVAILMLWFAIGMEIHKNSIPGKHQTTSVYDSLPEGLINGWIMSFCPMSLAALILYNLFRYNQRQRRNYAISLTNKFHCLENIYTTKCLIPMTLIYALTLIPVLPCALYLGTYSPIYGHDDPRIRFVAMLPHVLYDLNACSSVCWIIAKFPPIRQKLLSDLRRLGLSNNVVETEASVERQAAYVQATNAHFKHLQRIWN